MPTVIDSLVLELGLDPTKFTQQQRDAVNSIRSMEQEQLSAGKRIESEARRVGNILTDFRRTALQATAVFLGGMGIQQFTNFVTNLDASTGRLAKTMNMSAQDVSVWQGAVKQAGGTAEDANSALGGLSGEMNRFMLTGQSAMLPVLSRLGVSLVDQNRNLKTAGQLWLDIADSIQGMDSAKAAAFLQMVPGATQGMINLALLGPGKMREYLELQRQIGATTKESAEEAQKYQRALANLDSSATNLGRTIVTKLAPALTSALDAMRKFINGPDQETRDKTTKMLGVDDGKDSFWEQTASKVLGVPTKRGNQYRMGDMYGRPTGTATPPTPSEASTATTPAGAGASRSTVPGAVPSASQMEAFIRSEAIARGINPDVAVGVARSEGLFAYQYSKTGQSFVPGEQSFGPFQLNYGKDGRSLGDKFSRKTGLDARDPGTWQDQVRFSLDEAGAGGWGPWHGWKGGRFEGIPAGGRGGSAGGGSTVNIGTLNVNAPQAKDAPGIARELGPALERSVTAGAANQGPN
jgi:hypothetical protein